MTKSKFISSIFLLILTLALFSFWTDLGEALAAILVFPKAIFLVALIGSLISYLFRFLRWDHFLRIIFSHQQEPVRLSRKDSLLVFVSGLATVVTPLRTGEVLKAILVKQLTKVRGSKTVPVVVFERLTDGLAMLILMIAGLLRFRFGVKIFFGSLLIITLFIFLIQFEKVVFWLIDLPESLSWLRDFYLPIKKKLVNLYSHSCYLAKPKPLFLGTLLGILGWGAQMLGSALIVTKFINLPLDLNLFLTSLFIFSFSAAVGFGIPLPGGIGVAEPTVVGLLHLLLRIPSAEAVAATLLIRLSTIWFGVSLGAVAFRILTARFSQDQK